MTLLNNEQQIKELKERIKNKIEQEDDCDYCQSLPLAMKLVGILEEELEVCKSWLETVNKINKKANELEEELDRLEEGSDEYDCESK